MVKTSRVLSVLLISVLFMGLFSVIVAAQAITSTSQGMDEAIQAIKDVGNPIFKALLGSSATGEQWVVQILAFLLVTLVVYGLLTTIGVFGSKPWVNFMVGLLVAVLGTRFIPPDILTQLAVPSSAFVVILVLGLPLILLFYLMKDLPRIARRTAWVIYGVLVFILWVINVWKTEIPFAAKAVYPLIVIACIILFVLDGTFQRFLGKLKADKTIASTSNVAINKLAGEIKGLTEALSAETDKANPNQREIAKLQKKIDNKRKLMVQLQGI